MNRNDCFPKFFAIEEAGSYKIYYNEVEQTETSLNIPHNVLWPVDGVSLGSVLKSGTPSNDNKATFIRKWNGRHYRSCLWNTTGSVVEMIDSGNKEFVPVVTLDNCSEKTLPFNSYKMKPKAAHYAPVPMAPRFPVSSMMPVMNTH